MRTELTAILTTLALYFASTACPGPNFAVVTRLAICGSRRAALAASFGVASASLIYALLSMTGLTVLLSKIGWLANSVQILGGCYLVYLGLRAWLDASKTQPQQTSINPQKSLYGFRSGFFVGLSNPKSIAFFVGLYAAAIPSETASWAKIAIVVGGFVIEVMWYGFVAVLLSLPGARAIYIRFNAWSNRLVGALLVGFGLRLIYDRS